MPTVNKKSKAYPWKPKAAPMFESIKNRAWSQALYNSQRWRKMAKYEIMQEPYCVLCKQKGIVTTDNLQRDHINGFATEDEFWNGARQTLCKWHNMQKARSKGGEVAAKMLHKKD
jgi:hypothetical protein